jgi:hypothetical protein
MVAKISKEAAKEIGVRVLKSKYAKWAICGTIGFVAEHAAGSLFDKWVRLDVDVTDD